MTGEENTSLLKSGMDVELAVIEQPLQMQAATIVTATVSEFSYTGNPKVDLDAFVKRKLLNARRCVKFKQLKQQIHENPVPDLVEAEETGDVDDGIKAERPEEIERMEKFNKYVSREHDEEEFRPWREPERTAGKDDQRDDCVLNDMHKDEVYCLCGYAEKDHPKDVTPLAEDEEWHWKSCTEPFPTDAYGEINFATSKSYSTAKYVRLDSLTDAEHVTYILQQHWEMQKPQLFINVIGGRRNFANQKRQDLINSLKKFKRELAKTADLTDAWLFTGGSTHGVDGIVGDAVDQYVTVHPNRQITCIGVRPWGGTMEKESLLNGNAFDDQAWYYPRSKEGISEVLNSNYTHFLLYDRGQGPRCPDSVVDMTFSTKVQRYIYEEKANNFKESNSADISVVFIVLEGGFHTLIAIHQALRQGLPVILVTNFGGIAEFLGSNLYLRHGELEELLTSVRTWSRDQDPNNSTLNRIMEPVSTEDREKLAFLIEDCITIQNSEESTGYISTFDMNQDLNANGFNDTVFNAVWNQYTNTDCSALLPGQFPRILELVMKLRLPERARERLFHSAADNSEELMNMQKLDDLMLRAVKSDLIEFVSICQENNLDINKWLTHDILAEIYSFSLRANPETVCRNELTETDVPMANLLRKDIIKLTIHRQKHEALRTKAQRDEMFKEINVKVLHRIGQILSQLLGYNFSNPYKLVENAILNECLIEHDVMADMLTKPWQKSCDSGADNHLAIRDLFLFSILLNRQAMAYYFWKQSADFIGSALVASYLLRRLSEKAQLDDDYDLADELLVNSAEWERRAIDVTRHCSMIHSQRTHQLLLRVLPSWSFMTPLSIAQDGECMDFMALPVCQRLLKSIWFGDIANFTANSTIFAATLCPLLVWNIKFSPPRFKMNIRRRELIGAIFVDEGNVKVANEQRDNTVTPDSRTRIRTVSWVTDESKHQIGILLAISCFYTAPCTKFFTHAVFSNMIFLVLYAYLIVAGLHETITWLEIVIWVWMHILAMYEIKQAKVVTVIINKLFYRDRTAETQVGWAAVKGYFRDVWNKMDVVSFFILLLCIGLRVAASFKSEGVATSLIVIRSLYGLSYCVLVLRQLYNFYTAKNIGPYVIAIGQMLIDLYRFLLIFIVVICAFNVPLTGMKYNAELQLRDWYEVLGVFKRIFFEPLWWQLSPPEESDLQGNYRRDVTIAVLNEEECTVNRTLSSGDYIPCEKANPVYPIMLLIAIIISNTLLINTLIAMFSYTFEQVKDKADKIWAYTQYNLVKEFSERPALPPPFMVYSILANFFILVFKRCCRRTTEFEDTAFKKYYYDPSGADRAQPQSIVTKMLTNTDYKTLTEFERDGLDQFREEEANKSKPSEEVQLMTELAERIDNVCDMVSDMQNRSKELSTKLTEMKTPNPKDNIP